jgi:hypothetical protein
MVLGARPTATWQHREMAEVPNFETLQSELGAALALNIAGSTEPHVCIALPSFSVGESLLSHYVDRIPSLEHRYLVAALMLHRIPGLEMVFLSSAAPSDEVVDYYASLVPPDGQRAIRDRLRIVEVPDRSARSVAAKLLDQPAMLDALRDSIGGRPAFIEPWNVTPDEVEVALRLGAPINGTAPELWPLGYKSAGRKLFAAAGVPLPLGVEDVCSVDDVVAAVATIRRAHPDVRGVVIKHDNSGAGDGNVVLDLTGLDGAGVRAAVEALPQWYRNDLAVGGVVEELITGAAFTSPSVQIDIRPDGEAVVLSTHEQVLGGPDGQVYTGCCFPADPVYARELARHGTAVAHALAARGAIGRFALDFAAACDGDGRWRVFALEVNLRKGGTTHPFAALRHLAPGRYDCDAGCWTTHADGTPRAYRSTDNLVDPRWIGLSPPAVIGAVAAAGLQFDCDTGVGVVLHMLSGLAIDGRFGLTAIGHTDAHAAELYERTAAEMQRAFC